MDLYCRCETPLGTLYLAQDACALCGAWFEGQKHFPPALSSLPEGDSPLLREARLWLRAYFAGENPPLSLPLAPGGTAFQQEVWAILSTIPYGQTMRYGQIAELLAARRGLRCFSAQAVGQAVGRNPLSLFIPCHRVVGARGELTGYAGGVEKKRALLQLEGDSTKNRLLATLRHVLH